jgi:hypothetical protein
VELQLAGELGLDVDVDDGELVGRMEERRRPLLLRVACTTESLAEGTLTEALDWWAGTGEAVEAKASDRAHHRSIRHFAEVETLRLLVITLVDSIARASEGVGISETLFKRLSASPINEEGRVEEVLQNQQL